MVFYTNVLLPREHYALKELMPRLVFNEPTFTFLSPDTTEVFVHKLCEEMINIETNQQIRLNRNIENFFKDGVFGYSTYLDKPEQDYNQYIRFMETALHAKKDDGFLVRAFVKKYNERNIIDQVHIYDEWGFTPRLSEIKKEGAL